jgi:restriction system protein
MPAPFEKLLTYWYSLVIYDYTVLFCEKWIRSWKLKEQMVGAARSGKQNIVEGSESLKTSLKTCIKLTNVAKASLEELLEDYKDFLRQRGFAAWEKSDPRVVVFRGRAAKLVKNLSNLGNLGILRQALPFPAKPEEAANLLKTLCHQAAYLLSRQVVALEEKHKKEGGYTEKLYWTRKNYQNQHVPRRTSY